MAKGEDSPSEMAHARQSDGINVIFDRNSPASTRSSSSSRSNLDSSLSPRSSHHRRRRHTSSSSSASSSSTSRPRSRSHPRCHRRSSRCRCSRQAGHGHGGRRRSPSRRHRAHSRSYSRSPSSDRYTSSRSSRHRRTESRDRRRISRSPVRSDRSRSGSRSSGYAHSPRIQDNRELVSDAKTNTMTIQRVPERVRPDLSEKVMESREGSPQQQAWVRQAPEETLSQDSDDEAPHDFTNSKTLLKPKIISFSINNSVAKPTAAVAPLPKVTARVDTYDARTPYGQWTQVRKGKSLNRRQHAFLKSH